MSPSDDFPVRDDLSATHDAAWTRLGAPGTWLSARARVAMVRAARAAQDCPGCRAQKAALSPYTDTGVAHVDDPTGELDETQRRAVHRVSTDPGRLTRQLLEEWTASGRTVESYVEMLGVVSRTCAIDRFHRAVGLPQRPLPLPAPGSASEVRPERTVDIGAWVPVLDLASPEAEALYSESLRVSNVARSLSLVPAEVEQVVALVSAQYVPVRWVPTTEDLGRAITRPQMEWVASRVSSHNECFY